MARSGEIGGPPSSILGGGMAQPLNNHGASYTFFHLSHCQTVDPVMRRNLIGLRRLCLLHK